MNEEIKKATIDAYDTIAPEFSKAHFAPFWIEEFEEYKKLIPGTKVLDIGCGAGRDAAVFIQNGFDYTGVDASKEMLDVASQRMPKGKFIQIDFCHLDFLDNTFDGFWAAASFLHVPKKDVGILLEEAKRIIRSGGIGFISLKEKTEKEEGLIHQDKYGGIDRYFAFYTEDEFLGKLNEKKFEPLKVIRHQENDEQKTIWLCFFVKKK